MVNDYVDVGTCLAVDKGEEDLVPSSPNGANDAFDLSEVLLNLYGSDGSNRPSFCRTSLPPTLTSLTTLGCIVIIFSNPSRHCSG